MNLYELKKAMESDAIVENEKLKKEIEELKKGYEDKIKQLENRNQALEDDCRALSNRCWVNNSLMAGGTMCYFCELHGYKCEHEVSFNEKVRFAKIHMNRESK